MSKVSGGGDNISYHPDRQDICQKHRDNWIKMKNKMNEQQYSDYCEKRFSQPGQKNGRWKGGISSEPFICQCGKIVKTNVGQLCCNKCRDRTKEKNPFFGKKHSEQFLTRKSETRKLNPYKKPSNTLKVIIDGVLYQSQSEASKKLGCTIATISNRIKNPRFQNYKYEGVQKTTFKEKKTTGIPIIVNGKIFNSIQLAANFLNLSITAMANRLKKKNYPQVTLLDGSKPV